MKGLLIILFCYLSHFMFGQNDWLIGKWTCNGTLSHVSKFPETTKSFEKELCKTNWQFKKNGVVIWTKTDATGKPLGRDYDNSTTKGHWQLNVTNDTLFIYNFDIKYKSNYVIHKYGEKEFALVLPFDEVRRATLLIKK